MVMISANMAVMICGNDEIVNRILDHCSKALRVIITIREIRKHTLEKAAYLGVQVSLESIFSTRDNWVISLFQGKCVASLVKAS